MHKNLMFLDFCFGNSSDCKKYFINNFYEYNVADISSLTMYRFNFKRFLNSKILDILLSALCTKLILSKKN